MVPRSHAVGDGGSVSVDEDDGLEVGGASEGAGDAWSSSDSRRPRRRMVGAVSGSGDVEAASVKSTGRRCCCGWAGWRAWWRCMAPERMLERAKVGRRGPTHPLVPGDGGTDALVGEVRVRLGDRERSGEERFCPKRDRFPSASGKGLASELPLARKTLGANPRDHVRGRAIVALAATATTNLDREKRSRSADEGGQGCGQSLSRATRRWKILASTESETSVVGSLLMGPTRSMTRLGWSPEAITNDGLEYRTGIGCLELGGMENAEGSSGPDGAGGVHAVGHALGWSVSINACRLKRHGGRVLLR